MPQKPLIKLKNRDNRFYLYLFPAILVLAAFFIPSADDYGWATSDGLEVFHNGFFDNYNGRYLGNLTVLGFTRVPYLLPLIKATTLILIVYFIQKLISFKSRRFRIVSAIIILVPGALFIQSFVWTAGFCNYTLPLPIYLFCAYVLLNRNDLQGWKKAASIIVLFVLGIAGQLFMEPFTLFCLLFSAVALVYLSVKNHRFHLPACIYFGACIIGAVIMFSNSAYYNIAQGEDMYQSINADTSSIFGFLANGLYNLTHEVAFRGLIACAPALVFIFVLCIILFKKKYTKLSTKQKLLIYISFGIAALAGIAFPIYYYSVRDLVKASIFVFLLLLAIFTAWGLIIAFCTSSHTKKRTILYALMIAVLCAPLCFIFPMGSRCFSGIHILFILLSAQLFGELQTKPETEKQILPFKVLLSVLMAFNIVCYSIVCFGNMKKIESIREQVAQGKTVVTIHHTPLKFFVYSLDMENTRKSHEKRFNEYYAFPKETHVEYE
ncbi:MAG: hypothetical protein IKE65_02460 [Clostridia bacterium]|nr:hypothetical protein [Clostridia bacterium]